MGGEDLDIRPHQISDQRKKLRMGQQVLELVIFGDGIAHLDEAERTCLFRRALNTIESIDDREPPRDLIGREDTRQHQETITHEGLTLRRSKARQVSGMQVIDRTRHVSSAGGEVGIGVE
jgi:hypothetical protein